MLKEKFSYFTVLSNWILGFDKYSNSYSKKLLQLSTYPNEFYLLKNDEFFIGQEKALKLLKKLNIKNDYIIRIETEIHPHQIRRNNRTVKGWVFDQNNIRINKVFIINDNEEKEMLVEDITAMSFKLNNKLSNYQDLQPRTLSYLPISRGCQAKCLFCFSEASISAIQDVKTFDLDKLECIMISAKEKGVERFVITGGGEPTLLPWIKLIAVIELSKKYFKKTVLITNGLFLSNLSKENIILKIKALENAGLTVLAISHHHNDEEINAKIMGINTKTDYLLDVLKTINHNIILRLICVIQKNGISDLISTNNYLSYASFNNVQEVCFKELYISSTEESLYSKDKSNIYSQQNQVQLSTLIKSLISLNFKQINTLPWGSPIFEGFVTNKKIKVAAYTEPSVGWEKLNGICRSWNIMSDLKTYASLEDESSLIRINNEL